MAIRLRKSGTMVCAALSEERDGDIYIDDGTHYHLSVEKGLIVSYPWERHKDEPFWFWANNAPEGCDLTFVRN